MACNTLQLSYSDGGPSVPETWRRIAEVLDRRGLLDEMFKFDDKPVPGRRIGEMLVKRSSEHFGITGVGYEFDCVSWQIFIRKDSEGDAPCWDEWAATLSGIDLFVSGYLADREYEKWQNETDPRMYRLHSRAYEHLPMRSNGMPRPLERTIIDTSGNPGRRILRRQEGYVEAIGAVMWLGSRFSERTGADLGALKSADWCRVTEFAPGVLRVQVQEACFTSAEEREAELQNRLRAALFPRAV